ncbi:histidine kinase [Blautia schinkii]|nr:histidine kinase [Blautia schinkii]
MRNPFNSLKPLISNPLISKPHITVKILLLMLLFVVPLNVISILSSLEFFRYYAAQVETGLKNITDVYINTLDYHTERADLYLYEMLNNSQECAILERQGVLPYEYENAKYQCYNILSAQMEQEEVISGYFLIPKRTGDCIMTLDGTLGNGPEIKEYITGTKECDNLWHVVQLGDECVLLRTASEKNFYYGAVISLTSQQKEIEELGNYSSQRVSFTEGLPDTERNRIQALSKSRRMNLVLTMDVSRSECYKGISFWNRILIAFTFIFILAVPVIYTYMKKLIVRPLNRLNQGFCEIESGNRHYTVEDKAETREFQDAYDSFNRMVGSMESLRLDNIEKELDKKKLELDNLKLQIRPHFLLNTFNLMYYLLRSPDGTGEVRKLILYLSDYFRYLFRSDRDVELFDKELTLIEGYVEVAKIRYPNGLDISYDIDPEVRLIRVPPLLIHNFVENVVKHALSVGKCVHILLTAHYEEGWVQFEISDDGNGMSQEQVRKINERLWEQEETDHMGIRNAIRRIEYLYGPAARVRVRSQTEEGTTFTITFPYELEVEEE